MKRIMVYLIMSLFTFAIGVIVALNLLKKTDAAKISVEGDVSSRINSLPHTYQTDVLKIIHAPNEPVNIVDMRFTNTGDLLIEVENISPKPITIIEYILAPFDRCSKSDHPMAYGIGYGDMSV